MVVVKSWGAIAWPREAGHRRIAPICGALRGFTTNAPYASFRILQLYRILHILSRGDFAMDVVQADGPTEEDTATARRFLEALSAGELPQQLSLTIENQKVPIPAALVPALIAAARLVSEGHAVEVLPADAEISAQEAADILKVSRPYLLNLVKKGVLPYRMVGAHHRIPMAAVIAYKREQAPRRRSLESLSADTQDLGH
jgi:excisionase family DNA binding protein